MTEYLHKQCHHSLADDRFEEACERLLNLK